MSGSALSSSTSSAASGEVVYGGGVGGNGEPDQHVMSERVQQMAGAIYKEFERMIQRYDEDAVKELMPLVVSVLDSLDLAYLEKEEREVELELLREDNEQLVTQYEREKQLKRNAEQQSLEVQDHFEGEQKGLEEKIESLESIVRMLELKSKNASDHSNRLEEREQELKQEFSKLHERYTELLKNHMDYMERMKFVTGSEKFDMVNSMPSIPGGGFRPSHRESFDDNSVGSADYESLRTPTSISASGEFTPGLREVSDQLMERVPQAVTPSGGHPLSSELHEWQDELSPRMSDIMETTPELQDSARSIDRSPRRQSGFSEASEATNLSKEIAAASGDLPTDDPLGADLTVNDTFFGMGKEVENLIKENTELLETKNALNIVKNDLIAQVDELNSEHEMLKEEVRSHELVRAKLQEKTSELDEEIKKLREEIEELKKSKDDEDDVPMAQRKRFTRVEMARVLMERNQYKEKLMELQEAVRWTEMIRASKSDPSLKRKQRGSIWDFFSGLFTSDGMSASAGSASATHVRYSATPHAHQVIPGTDPMLRRKTADRHKAFDFLDTEHTSEKRAQERKEQYRLVRAHVKKDESGRMQAYGWSIPAMDCKQPSLPVPVYCRPLNDKDPLLKIWCATGIVLNGGRTKDGGYIVGGSVFYSKPPRSPEPKPVGDVQKLDQELKAQQVDYEAHAEAEWNYCSLVWICSSAHGKSRVAVIDANNPGEVLHSFTVCSSHVLTVSSIPGTKEDDFLIPESEDPQQLCHEGSSDWEDGCQLGRVSWVPLTPQGDGVHYSAPTSRPDDTEKEPKESAADDIADDITSPLSASLASSLPAAVTSSEQAADLLSGVVSSAGQDKLNPPSRATSSTKINIRSFPPHIQDGLAKYSGIPENTLTLSPTVWMGAQSGKIYVHSAVQNWKKCVRCIKVDDAVLSIVHYKGRVFAALANGTMMMFRRDNSGEWSMAGYHVICLGKPQHSVRSLTVVAGRVWASYRNTVHVVDPVTYDVVHSMAVHPRKESQVRQLVWVGDGVWCSIRLDSTLRLYHAHTFQHLQDVDIEPYVSKMLGTSKLGFSFVRITSLLVSCQRLWIGTGNGVVMSVPLNGQSQAPVHPDRHKSILTSSDSVSDKSAGSVVEGSSEAMPTQSTPGPSSSAGAAMKGPGGVVRVYTDPTAGSEKVVPGTFVPYCTMAHAQLSFHGHKDAVKFFVSVPGVGPNTPVTGVRNGDGTENKTKDSTKIMTSSAGGGPKERMMVVSGGDGYIDFRVGEDEEEGDDDDVGEGDMGDQSHSGASSPRTPLGAVHKRDTSHLIVWEVQGDK